MSVILVTMISLYIEDQHIICFLNDSSPGYDDIRSLVINEAYVSFLHPLTYLINRSFVDGVFPSELKICIIIPVFKSGNKSIIEKYRPISIYEEIMSNYLF